MTYKSNALKKIRSLGKETSRCVITLNEPLKPEEFEKMFSKFKAKRQDIAWPSHFGNGPEYFLEVQDLRFVLIDNKQIAYT